MGQTRGTSGRRRRVEGRDAQGRFQAGYSGNPYGPRKQPEVPKLLSETLAEKLWTKVEHTGPDGKTRMVSP